MENQDMAQAAYEAHLPAAQALPAERVLEFRVDPAVAIININQAVQLLQRHGEQIAQHLPKLALDELTSLPELAMAVTWSAIRAQNAISGDVTPAEMIAEGWKIRGTLMPVVAGLAGLGVIGQAVYDNIARGRGPRDMAADCVALSLVFRDHQAEIDGKHGVSAELIARAEAVGSWLLANLRTRTAPKAGTSSPEIDIRDRMATLLVERYRKLRAVAYYFYYDDYAEHAPPLNSRRVPKKRPGDDAEPSDGAELSDGAEPSAGTEPG
jgi:hypothetical protein